jgi:hypothetical protein
MVLSETFWIAFVSTASASFLVCLRWAYKSKCNHVECCCIKVDRDVHGEERLDMVIPPSPNNSSNKMERQISL